MTERLQRELETLPVAAVAATLNETLRRQTTAIVTAAPGAGKSTVLPLTMLEGLQRYPPEAGRQGTPEDAGKVIVLEPRRVAARQIASRMAWLLGEAVGATVGYRIRFESKVSAATRIEVVTEGVLTRMLLDDPALEGVSVVVFDEFHERSLNTDEAFALTRQCQQLLRDDLRIVVMSATIDTATLAATLRCPVLQSEGRMFPVAVRRTEEEADVTNVSPLVAKTIVQAHRSHEGDILAFLPGEGEIRRVMELLDGSLGATKVYPLYGLLSNDEQARAIAPSRSGERKVVLATPIAETSLTIEGVRVVVDSGLCRKMVFDARSGLNHLETVRISMDMATQRTGRAGRVAPGVCYRLWSTATESRMAAVRTPEILEADLTSLLLDSAIWGEREVESLPWLTPPPRQAAAHARQLLLSLGAIDDAGRATDWGRRLSRLPSHPRIAQMLLTADTAERRALAADIAALLEEKDPLAGEGDAALDSRIDALRRERSSEKPGRWGRIARIARQYADMIHAREDNTSVNPYEAGALLASAYPERIGRAWKEGVGVFQLSGGGLVSVMAEANSCVPSVASDQRSSASLFTLHSSLTSEWIVAASVHQKIGGVGRVFLASVADPADLRRYARERDNVFWDAKAGAVVARREVRIGAILMDAKPLDPTEKLRERVQQLVCEAIVKDGPSMLSFSDEVQNMQRRIAFVATRHPELALPAVDMQAICESAQEWGPFFVGKASTVAELKKIDLREVVWSRLSYEQQQTVERLAPTHVVVPTGSRIHLDYRVGAEAPVLRVRLQECFGLTDTPQADGQPVLMELLSPGFKPVQLTTDLHSFWQSTYFDVRKELRRRYPKHSWPDNPLEANPVKGVGRSIRSC
ncbi:MAG: ATP-dependent helicase HrpB [Prevotella sp.]|nr:ATP-dependent helicase HrpB [Prevotella sp.]